ncbi:MAG: hypothetical protein ACXWT0_01595 [Methylobacter sp.]
MYAAIQVNEAGRILGSIVATGDSIVFSESVISVDYDTYDDLLEQPNMGDLHWYDAGIVSARPVNPAVIDKTDCLADGVDTVHVTNIPIGATISLGALSEVASVATADLQFDIAGTYELTVSLFPYLDFKATIHAT